MQRPDLIRIEHMLDAAREAVTFTTGHSRADLDANRMLVLAVVKSIEIIGEAASRVTAAGRADASGLPWQQIVAMRNRLIHAYFDVDLDIVWSTVQNELPPLIADLELIVAAHRPE
jgi:uncharacterized protein with HEPN domain